MIPTNTIVNAYLIAGGIGLACCFTMHQFSAEDARSPITLEYARGNPVAILFFLTVLASASLAAWIFHRGKAMVESRLHLFVVGAVAIIMITSPNSTSHLMALLITVFLATIVPVVFTFQSEITLSRIVLCTTPITLALVTSIGSLSPEMGLGMAERIWYGSSYIAHALIIKMMFDDERFDEEISQISE